MNNMDINLKESVETINNEIALKAKTIAMIVWEDANDEKAVSYIKDKLHEIDTLLDIRTKIME